MQINWDELTLDEVEEIELLTDRSIDSIMDDGAPRGRTFKVIIWVLRKRTDPNYTLQDAGKVSLAEAAEMFAGDVKNPK